MIIAIPIVVVVRVVDILSLLFSSSLEQPITLLKLTFVCSPQASLSAFLLALVVPVFEPLTSQGGLLSSWSPVAMVSDCNCGHQFTVSINFSKLYMDVIVSSRP